MGRVLGGAKNAAYCGVPKFLEQINRLRENHKVIARRRANARRRVFDKIILQILYFMI